MEKTQIMERLSFITNKLHCSVKVKVGMRMVGGVVRRRLTFITNKLYCFLKVVDWWGWGWWGFCGRCGRGWGDGCLVWMVREGKGLYFIPNKLYCFVKVGVGKVVMKKFLLHPYFVKAARRSGWGWEYRRKWEERDRVGIGKGRLGGDGFQEKGD